MATYYVGVRPVLRGRDADNFIHYWKNKVGVYSNWSLQDTGSKLLAGFPDNEYVLGTRKHARILEYIFSGKQHVAPMDGAGGGTRLSYHRTNPWQYKGTVPAMPAGYGHAARDLYYGTYSNFVFDGLPSTEGLPSATTGHARRFTTTYGGAFNPYIFNGTPSSLAMTNVGQALPATAMSSNYGHNKVNEWRGVPSSKAL